MSDSVGEPSPSRGATATPLPGAAGTKQQILATAERLFAERGYDATSLRQIADSVGMTKAAVYYHYPAKEHLLLELTRPMLDAMSHMVATLRTGEGDRADPAQALEAYLDLFIEHLPVVRLMAQDPATMHHPDIGQRIRHLVDAIRQQIAGVDADQDHVVRTGCAMGVVHAVATFTPEAAQQHREVILAAALAALESSG